MIEASVARIGMAAESFFDLLAMAGLRLCGAAAPAC
jgi:hypothetical protein